MVGPETYTSDASAVTLPWLSVCHDALMPSPPTDVHISDPSDEVSQGHGIGLPTTPVVVHRSHHRATTPLAYLISLVRGRSQGRGGRFGSVRGRNGRGRGGRGRGSGRGKGGDTILVGDPVSQLCDAEPSQLQDRRSKRLRKKPSCGT
ncbi:unnamed protein product [Ilex paraguariensis]|uniref:Uncharacterized protein n=1 Tax=Ilex paraguariensis TaxID=185542 RepID=A0ABC8UWE9_9AQUA